MAAPKLPAEVAHRESQLETPCLMWNSDFLRDGPVKARIMWPKC